MTIKKIIVNLNGKSQLLTVKLIPDGSKWWVEGVEYDYGAQGDTPTEAFDSFKKGFEATVALNLLKGKTLDDLKWSVKR